MTSALRDAGYHPVAVVGRGRQTERAFARRIGSPFLTELPKDIDNIDFILTTLPTSKLAGYAKELARLPLPWKRLTFIHASGSFGIEPFVPLRERGAGVAAMHPYQTFPKKQKSVNLKGVTYGITGNRKGTIRARRIVRDIGGRALLLKESDRMLYHLSAILACTFVAADVDMAVRVLGSLGISRRDAERAVLVISGETIRNVKELGIRAAMTGPQTRGDRALIERHLRELRKRVPELAEAYRSVSEAIMKSMDRSIKKK